VTTERQQRLAQLRYAAALLRTGQYREFLRRLVDTVRFEAGRALRGSEEKAYLRYLRTLERDTAPRWTPSDGPLVSLLVPAGPPGRVHLTIDSALRQSYPRFEILYATDARLPTDARLRRVDGDLAALWRAAEGDLAALVLPGDWLLPRALEQAAERLWTHPESSLVYTDEGILDAGGSPYRPRFKPDWSPDLLLSLPYTGQLSLFRKELADRAGGLRADLPPQIALHDLTLRTTELAPPVHLAELSYQRRLLPVSVATRQWAEVVKDALDRRGIAATAEPGAAGRSSVTVRHHITRAPPVAIVVPFRDRVDLLRRCVESVRARSSYDRFELVLVDNQSTDAATLEYCATLERHGQARVVRYPHAFNFAAINNFGVQHTDAEQVILLNNDTEVITPDWIEALLEHAQRPEVGMVGARLLYPDGTLQHAGVVVGLGGLAGHPFDGTDADGAAAADACGHGGEVMTVRNVSAVTAACAMIRRPLYLEVGGMDEHAFPVAYNDVDLCLRLRDRGLQIVYTPLCTLIHHTSATRDAARHHVHEDESLRARWGELLKRDPYYNPNLSLREAYRPRFAE
jgi:GT2 family glycosyltransferase